MAIQESKSSPRFNGFVRQKKERADKAVLMARKKQVLLKDLIPLFRKYKLTRVYIFGSVLSGACRKDSDIDLYVESIEPEMYWELWKELEEKTDESIDLFCQRDDPIFIQKIIERGRLIYEA